MLTAVRRICGRIMHSQTALRGQWDKGWKNQFAARHHDLEIIGMVSIKNFVNHLQLLFGKHFNM